MDPLKGNQKYRVPVSSASAMRFRREMYIYHEASLTQTRKKYASSCRVVLSSIGTMSLAYSRM